MKKSGTPMGAGPGSESENVGLLAVGTPLPLGRLEGLLGGLACDGFDGAFFFGGAAGTCGWGWDEDCSPLPFALGAGVVEELLVVVEDDEEEDVVREGEVEVELELGPGEVDVPEVVVDELEPAGVVVEEVELLVDGAHEADWSVLPGGSAICDGLVPGGTFSVNVSDAPDASLTVTVHVSAEADALPSTSAATSALASASTPVSLGRRVTTALFLRPSCSYALQWGNESRLRRARASY
jgi:hypothetical protein